MKEPVNRTPIRRLIGVTTAAVLLLAALGVAPVSAALPSWDVEFVPRPAMVAPGNNAGWDVQVWNDGPSNINDLRVTIDSTSTTASYSYFTGIVTAAGSDATCTTAAGATTCLVGTLPAYTHLDFTVAFPVAESYAQGSFNLTVSLRAGTGDTTSDGPKKKSRGDDQDFPTSVVVNDDENFDGGFVFGDLGFATTGSLGRNNKQTSAVDVPDLRVTVNIEDEITDELCTTADDPLCANQIGEWTRLTVPGSTGYLKLTLNIWGGSVPGGTGADDIFLIHVLDNGDVEVLGDDPVNQPNEICADPNTAPTSGECIYVTKVGSNFRIVAWLLKNGSLRGGI
jgi:hypothetical protein